MAKDTAVSYFDFVSDLSYDLYEVASRAMATHALLSETKHADDSEEIVAVTFLLCGIKARIDQLAERVSNSQFTYSLKGKRHE